ncbi:MAG: hypothetical protein RLZZ618_1342 [Pseudomonadota bacterium]|jgi:SAM-dependent methyltransferase
MPDALPPSLVAAPAVSRGADTTPAEQFLHAVQASLDDGSFAKLILAKHRGAEPTLKRVAVRPVTLKGEACLSFVASHTTKDITQNLPRAEGLRQLAELIDSSFSHAHLLTASAEVQLLISKKGKQTLLRSAAAHVPVADDAHNREKHRWIDQGRPFLQALGVTDAQGQVVPSMSRKWKQINKFVEVFSGALSATPLAKSDRPVHVVDFGSGKGYLTFAIHDHLRHTLGLQARVTGVELRQDMVRLCQRAAAAVGAEGLRFDEGDVRSYTPEAIDVMIALHACDVATDYAIHLGLRAGASVILCSPCCHKQIRPQLMLPKPLGPLLQHGVHLGQEAEMLTDGLRALLLEAAGYDTQVFEFISLEHTNKNKMILAVKRNYAGPAEEVLAQIRELKAFYGIKEHCLETLLAADEA